MTDQFRILKGKCLAWSVTLSSFFPFFDLPDWCLDPQNLVVIWSNDPPTAKSYLQAWINRMLVVKSGLNTVEALVSLVSRHPQYERMVHVCNWSWPFEIIVSYVATSGVRVVQKILFGYTVVLMANDIVMDVFWSVTGFVCKKKRSLKLIL